MFGRQSLNIFMVITCVINVCVSDKPCASFYGVDIYVVQSNAPAFNTIVNGCIQRQNFDADNDVLEVHVVEQNVKALTRDAVRNMPRLTVLNFTNCPLREIRPGSLKNLPRLRNFEVSSSGLTKIHYGVFNNLPKISTIKIYNTDLYDIETQAFGYLTTLRKVYLNNNQLEYYSKDWFTNSTKVEILNLQFNKIKTIERKSFNNLRELKQLLLDYNEISSLEANCFAGLRQMDYLGLTFNRLKKIPSAIFPNSVKIGFLNVGANYLNFLSTKLLDKLTVDEIVLDANPWKCSCLLKIYDWLYNIDGELSKSEVCSDIPICYSTSVGEKTCSETENERLRDKYVGALKEIADLDPYCARLD